MAQTPCKRVSEGMRVPYTFTADAAVGDVVEVGTVPGIVAAAVDYSEQAMGVLDFSGMWDVPQVAGVITAGDAVYWDNNGSPYGGTASSGCATGTASGNNLMGFAAPIQPNATNATTATDSYVRVVLTSAKRTATIAGSVTADDITGSDASLAIAGKAGASGAGGAVALAGGAGDGAAGGAVSTTGGAGGASQTGGAVSLVGGAPASGNAAGGTAAVTGGAGAGTGAGGATAVTGGASGAGATGNGGAASIVGGAASSTNGTGGAVAVTGGVGTGTGVGGAVAITSGASGGASGTAGALTIDTGAASGGTGAGITIGGTNATSITLGKMPIIPCATVAATGAAQSNAAALTAGFTLVTDADATTGVKLPAAAAGLVCIIKNRDSDNAVLKVYPNTADAINALEANASLDMAAKTCAMLVAYDATTWYSLPLLPS